MLADFLQPWLDRSGRLGYCSINLEDQCIIDGWHYLTAVNRRGRLLCQKLYLIPRKRVLCSLHSLLSPVFRHQVVVKQ